ncbi:MAG: prolyl oligopeptidase family serine peptidase [Rhodothalassiaceae bacterium]
MKRLWIAGAACAALAAASALSAQEAQRRQDGNLVIEGIPEQIPSQVQETLRRYQNVRGAGFTAWRPQGDGMLIVTRFGETAQIHHVEEPGGARRQLTFFDEPVSGAAYPSEDETPPGFVITKDVGGSEDYQLYLVDGGDVRQLTEGGGRKGGATWADDGSKFAFNETTETGDWRIRVADADALSQSEILFEGQGAWFPIEFSPSGDRLLAAKYTSINDSEIWIIDAASGETQQINPSEAAISYGGAQFHPEGKSVLYTSDEDAQFRRLVRYDLDSGEKTVLTPDIDWNVESFDITPDGRTLAFTVNEEGFSTLYLRRLRNNKAIDAPKLPTGVVSGLRFDAEGQDLAFTLSPANGPSDVYVWDLDDKELERWTHSEIGGLDESAFVTPELIKYESFDGLTIPAFVYQPEGPGPHPVVIDIHGGPEGQDRPTFSSTIQYWVNELGLAVITPNVRGSAGYGKDYLKLDNARLREDSVKDIGALLDWVEGQPDRFDAERIGVYGGSYGGYMVYASLVHYDPRIAAAVDIVGISNFVTFLENTRGYRRKLRRVEYGDESDPEMRAFLESISPLTHADKITTPLFIIQGANDPRVPASEAEQMLEAVRENGGAPWYLLALDEGHGFRKKSNRDFMQEAVAWFWKTRLIEPQGQEEGA